MSARSQGRGLPLLLSALAYPGAGQFLQKRPVWGLVYGIAFTLFAILSIKLLAPPIWQACTALFAGDIPDRVEWRPLLKPLALAGGVYLANLYDVWWHDWKRAHAPPPIPR
jgi:hypothetical protein